MSLLDYFESIESNLHDGKVAYERNQPFVVLHHLNEIQKSINVLKQLQTQQSGIVSPPVSNTDGQINISPPTSSSIGSALDAKLNEHLAKTGQDMSGLVQAPIPQHMTQPRPRLLDSARSMSSLSMSSMSSGSDMSTTSVHPPSNTQIRGTKRAAPGPLNLPNNINQKHLRTSSANTPASLLDNMTLSDGFTTPINTSIPISPQPTPPANFTQAHMQQHQNLMAAAVAAAAAAAGTQSPMIQSPVNQMPNLSLPSDPNMAAAAMVAALAQSNQQQQQQQAQQQQQQQAQAQAQAQIQQQAHAQAHVQIQQQMLRLNTKMQDTPTIPSQQMNLQNSMDILPSASMAPSGPNPPPPTPADPLMALQQAQQRQELQRQQGNDAGAVAAAAAAAAIVAAGGGPDLLAGFNLASGLNDQELANSLHQLQQQQQQEAVAQAQAQAQAHVQAQVQAQTQSMSMAMQSNPSQSSTGMDMETADPRLLMSTGTTANHTPNLDSDGFDNYGDSDMGGHSERHVASENSGHNGAAYQPFEPEMLAKLDEVFFEFLQAICSNLDATDAKGDPIHQTLMAKKMQKLDESPDFRPFKFRIQAFTNAFHEELQRRGLTEDVLPTKRVRQYLWTNRFISRFNEDGRKAKSKGNHVWNIEARKLTSGGWTFKEFTRRLTGLSNKTAYHGMKWSWSPRVWDPQVTISSATFSSPWLPDWLSWDTDGTTLQGVPSVESPSCEITIEARFTHAGEPEILNQSVFLDVAPADAAEFQAVKPGHNHSLSASSIDAMMSQTFSEDTSLTSTPRMSVSPEENMEANGGGLSLEAGLNEAFGTFA